MKSLDQIKDEVGRDLMNESPRTSRNAPRDWRSFIVWNMADRDDVERAMEEVARRYAKEAVKAKQTNNT